MANSITSVLPQDDHARIELTLSTDGTNFNILKYSSLDNFSSYQIIPITNSTSGTSYYYDYVIEPGVFYKYKIPLTNILGVDGGCESLTPFTTVGTVSLSTTQVKSGTNSIKTSTSGSISQFYKDYSYKLDTSKQYIVAGWFFIESYTSGTPRIRITDYQLTTLRYETTISTSTIGSWQFVYIKIPLSNTIIGNGFRLAIQSGSSNGTMAFYSDSIRIYEVDSNTYSAIGTTYTASTSPSIDDVLPYSENSYTAGIPTSAYLVGSTGSFLLGANNTQLNFIYNSSISDFKKIKKDSIVETIGSQYPYIIRASNIGYKQLLFSGTIVADTDTALSLSGGTYSKLFLGTSSSDTTLNSLYTGSGYKTTYNPDKNQNFVLEKFFRKNVLNWLNDGAVKVFKSDTEDMILGRVTDVSLSPMEGTSRIIYNVSFTFTEINSIDKAKDYGLYKTSLESARLTNTFESNSF